MIRYALIFIKINKKSNNFEELLDGSDRQLY